MKTQQDFACPDSATGSEQCYKCRERTGFNPAFYNSGKISPAQEARNHEPHVLYLAHFGGDFTKVGIAFHERRLSRLLEQGARAGVILGEFQTANVARFYEAKVAKMNGFSEAVLASKKLKLLKNLFDFNRAKIDLKNARAKINSELGTNFAGEILHFDNSYARKKLPTDFVFLPREKCEIVSGEFIALAGAFMFFQNSDHIFAVNIKDFSGYKFNSFDDILSIKMPPQQMHLF